MAGGKGTRFWPESIQKKPKQYLNLISDKTLLEETLVRFDHFIEKENRFIVTVKEQKKLCKISSRGLINKNGLIFEPAGRNTGPCILMSLATLINRGVSENDVVAIVPSDHVILNKKGFQSTLKKAADFSFKNQQMVTIGITPNFPHTGFGYIQKGKMINGEVFKVSQFKEKPHLELAVEYVKSGRYLWNAGMFVAPLKVFLEEFALHAPLMFDHYNSLMKTLNKPALFKKNYSRIPSDSIDYAIMEKSKRLVVMPANFDWNDLGSWDALSSVINETQGNTIVKSKGEFFLNSTDNVIFAPKHFVATINMKEHIIVANEKVLMIVPVKDAQEIKKIVEYLKKTRPDLI